MRCSRRTTVCSRVCSTFHGSQSTVRPVGPNRVLPSTLAAFKSKLLLQASEFFQDSYLVKVLCGVLGERLLSTDAPATNHSTEHPSATTASAPGKTFYASFNFFLCGCNHTVDTARPCRLWSHFLAQVRLNQDCRTRIAEPGLPNQDCRTRIAEPGLPQSHATSYLLRHISRVFQNF